MRKRRVERLLYVYLMLFTIAAVACWSNLRLGFSPNNGNIISAHFPLFDPSDRMRDLMNYQWKVQHIHEGAAVFGGPGPIFNYPAPAAYVLVFFLKVMPYHRTAYRVAFGLALLLCSGIFVRALRNSAIRPSLAYLLVLSTLLLAYPHIFTMDRGNLEWINWFFATLGVICFYRRWYMFSALAIGLALCMKPFPILLFLLLLQRKRYKEVAAGIGLTAALIVTSLWALGPSIAKAYVGLQYGFRDYVRMYLLDIRDRNEFRFNHSLLDAVKVVLWRFYFDHSAPVNRDLIEPGLPFLVRIDVWYRIVAVFALVVLIWGIWFFRKRPVLNQVFAVTLAITTLPFVAADYTLLIMYIPFGFFLVFLSRDVALGETDFSLRAAAGILACFVVLFVSEAAFMAYTPGMVKTLALVGMFVLVTANPMPMRSFSASTDSAGNEFVTQAAPQPAGALGLG